MNIKERKKNIIQAGYKAVEELVKVAKEAIVDEVVRPIKINTIKRLNKSKKWKYGYNKEHDVVVISKTGMIGEIYEIQNLRIALPQQPKQVHKFKSDKWEVTEYPKELNRIKTIFDWKEYPQDFKSKYINYIENEFNTFSGKLARQTYDRTDCATLRIVDQAFPLWHQERWLTWQPYLATPDMVFYLSLDPMRKRCSQIKWFRYPLITHSFSNLSRTEWTVQRPSLPSASPRPSSQDGTLSVPTNPKPYRVSIPRSTGRTPVITPMMVRNSNSSSTMRVVSGNARTTSSTTGVLRKPPLD